jgi:hypothetical protein
VPIIGENLFIIFQFCLIFLSVIGVFKGGANTNDESEKWTM